MDLITLILPCLITVIAIVITYYISKFLKITIDKQIIENLLYSIINQITDIELKYKGETGLQKQKRVIAEIEQGFPHKEKTILKRVFGSIDVAVEKAFQLSHLAKNTKQLFS